MKFGGDSLVFLCSSSSSFFVSPSSWNSLDQLPVVFGVNLSFKQGLERNCDGGMRQWQMCIPFNKFADWGFTVLSFTS
ncbi:hypothetical protein F0562_008252 [Nyssa sinensis]|uniref:Uncharacterized protein n=1 Tax=Nyssa sinensis TaxID=561372 RepID=A0A5J5A624_9ASTE|nr:hypothetical protein F0562_008252 [Nyssa sinensis]